MCPEGSSGPPQNGQGGRPAATTAWARRAKARACGGVRTTLSRLVLSGRPGSSSQGTPPSSPSGLSGGGLGVVVEALDDDPARLAVPREGDRHDPELDLDGCVERKVVAICRGRLLARGAARHLVEDVVDPVGEDGHLLLLERDRRDRPALAGLEKEDPLTGRPDGARDESLGGVELEDRHTDDTNPQTRPLPSRLPHPLRRRRGARVPRRRSATLRQRS